MIDGAALVMSHCVGNLAKWDRVTILVRELEVLEKALAEKKGRWILCSDTYRVIATEGVHVCLSHPYKLDVLFRSQLLSK